jgi:hypothetical protein
MKDIGRIFAASYRDARRSMSEAGSAIFVAAIVMLIGSMLDSILEPAIGTRLGRVVLGWLIQVGISWTSAPAIVALYRYLIAGERPGKVNPNDRSNSANAYFYVTVWFSVVATLPQLAEAIFEPPVQEGAQLVSSGTTLVAYALFWYLVTRLSTYLPGVAMGRGIETLTSAFGETRGRFWFIAATFFLTLLPAVAVAGLVAFLVSSLPWWIAKPIIWLPGVAILVIGIATTSRLYRRIALGETAD